MKTVKNDLRTCDNIRKIATGQGSDCATGCLLDCPYFDLIKQQKLDGDPKAIQQINITGNLNRAEAQPANIGPQDVQRTSRGRPEDVQRTFPSSIPRTSPKGPI